MNWYEREKIAESRRRELDRANEQKRQTSFGRKPVQFWLLATMRTWIISATR